MTMTNFAAPEASGYPTEERYIIIHCSATFPGQNWRASDIRDYHKNVKGWSDIGYHIVICLDGDIELGREMPGFGAHARGTTLWGPMNKVGIGVCLIGGLDHDGVPTDEFYRPQQWQSLRTVVVDLMAEHMIPFDRVLGHRDVINDPQFDSPDPPKACPCFEVKGWMLRSGLAVPPIPDLSAILNAPAGDPLVLPPTYIVAAKDTYFSIGRRFGVSLDVLSRVNPNFPDLAAGEEIRLQ